MLPGARCLCQNLAQVGGTCFAQPCNSFPQAPAPTGCSEGVPCVLRPGRTTADPALSSGQAWRTAPGSRPPICSPRLQLPRWVLRHLVHDSGVDLCCGRVRLVWHPRYGIRCVIQHGGVFRGPIGGHPDGEIHRRAADVHQALYLIWFAGQVGVVVDGSDEGGGAGDASSTKV